MQQQQQLALGCTYVLVLVADWLRTVSLWQRRRQAERPGARRCRGDLCAAQPSSTALPFSYRFTGCARCRADFATPHAKLGDLGSTLPAIKTGVVWTAGQAVEVAWTVRVLLSPGSLVLAAVIAETRHRAGKYENVKISVSSYYDESDYLPPHPYVRR
jgi:hypothetical protein